MLNYNKEYIDKQLELKKKYPHVFKIFLSGTKENQAFWPSQIWGLECGPGWLGIIEECAMKIEKLIENWSEVSKENTYAVQIKEKFGTLNIYMNLYNEDIDKIISEAELKSKEICEFCGKKGELRHGSWLQTLCDDCYGKR